MGIILRQSTIGSFLYYIRVVIISINVLWLFPYILTTEQIGLYKFILSCVSLFSSIAQFGLGQSVIKYLPEFEKEKSAFLGFITISTTAGYLIFISILFLFRDHIAILFKKNAPNVIRYFLLIIATSLALLYSIILKAWFRSLLKTLFPTFVQNIVIFFSMSISAILYYFKLINFNTLLIGIFFIYLFGLFLLTTYLLYIKEFRISFKFSSIKYSFMKRFLTYNLYTLAGSSGYTIVTKIDAIMIASIIGLRANGIYATVILLANLIEIPRRAVKQISVPVLSKMISQKQYLEIELMYKKLSINQLAVGAFLFTVIYANLDIIFKIIPNTQDFQTGKFVVLFLAITKLLDALFSLGSDIVIMSEYFRFNIISLIILGSLTVITNMIMIPKYGITGAAGATAISYLIYNLSTCFYVFKKFKMHPFSPKILLIPVMIISSYLFTKIFKSTGNNFIDILLNSLISSFSYIFLLINLNISPDLNKYFFKLKSAFMSKIGRDI